MTLCLLVIIYPRFEARFVVRRILLHISSWQSSMAILYSGNASCSEKVGYKLQIEPMSCVSEDLNFLNVSTSGIVKFFSGW
jgi:hypothetical protein